ncbi:MAG: hypothetical protein ACR2M6_02745 [Vampirovibrionia bacterium]
MSDKRYNDIYKDFSEELKQRLDMILKWKNPRYLRNYNLYFCDFFDDVSDFKRFMKYFSSFEIDIDSDSDSELGVDVDDNEDLLHNKSYWYDSKEDKYIIYLKNKSRPMVLLGVHWRSIKESYSNWTGKASSMNEICRKYELSRSTLKALLRVMGMTHDSSPFSDERILNSSHEELVEELIRKKEESILLEGNRREYRLMKKYYEIYRNHRKYAEEIGYLISENADIGLNEKSVFPYDLKEEISNSILLVSPTDFHWGKYAGTHTESAYNRNIAEERLFYCTDRLMRRVLLRGLPRKIVVGLGGDGLHIDNIQKMTTRGTPQDVDGSPIEIVHSYIDLCRRYVLYLRKFCEVDVYVVNGNHDFYSSIFLRASLQACFDGYDKINVISDLNVRQTFTYGNSLISFIHGDEGSVKDYPAIIANEKAEMWGKTKWRYIFTGHFHTERELPTFGGVIVHRMPSLAGTDDWHHRKGYSSRKSLIGYVIDKEEGLVSKEMVNV